MPNWSDGEGGCDCPSGHAAGLGFHRAGEPGCVSGPELLKSEADLKKKQKRVLHILHDLRRDLASVRHERVVLLNNILGGVLKDLEAIFATPTARARVDAKSDAKPKTEIRGVIEKGKKGFYSNVEELIARSTVGAAAAKEEGFDLSSVPDEVVRRTLERAGELERYQRQMFTCPRCKKKPFTMLHLVPGEELARCAECLFELVRDGVGGGPAHRQDAQMTESLRRVVNGKVDPPTGDDLGGALFEDESQPVPAPNLDAYLEDFRKDMHRFIQEAFDLGVQHGRALAKKEKKT